MVALEILVFYSLHHEDPWNGVFWNFGENPLRCTTDDEKGLVLIVVIFYFIFLSP
jgi:hypothetical protein